MIWEISPNRLNIGCPRAQLNAALERMKDVLN